MQHLQTFLQFCNGLVFCADMLLDNFFFEIIKRANPYHKVVPFFAKDDEFHLYSTTSRCCCSSEIGCRDFEGNNWVTSKAMTLK